MSLFNSRKVNVRKRPPKAPAKRKKTLVRLVKLIGVYLAFVALFFGLKEGYAWVGRQSWFNVANVEVLGNETINASEIRALSRLVPGTSIFDVDVKECARFIEDHDWIKIARVRRVLPQTIRIEVVEHHVAGLLQLDQIYYVDEEGTPFTIAPEGAEGSSPVIEGLKAEDFEPKSVGQRKVRRALDLIAAYQGHPMALEAPLSRILFQQDGLALKVGPYHTELVFGRDVQQDSLDRALKLWRHLSQRGEAPESIHLDNRLEPQRLAVRIRSAETAVEEDTGPARTDASSNHLSEGR